MSGPYGGTYDGGLAATRRRLDKVIRDGGWHVRYDGGSDQFIASKDKVAAHSLDELLVEMERTDRAGPDDAG